jgi:hypothetical protein
MALHNQQKLETATSKATIKNPIKFDTLPDFTRNNLIKLANAVIGVVPDEQKTWVIQSSQLDPDSMVPQIVGEVARWAGKGSKFLYCLDSVGHPDL